MKRTFLMWFSSFIVDIWGAVRTCDAGCRAINTLRRQFAGLGDQEAPGTGDYRRWLCHYPGRAGVS